MQENKCSIQEYWEEAKRNCDEGKKKSMRTYAVYGNTAAAAELILAEDRKRHFRDRRRKRAKWRLWYGNSFDRYGVVVSALLGLLGRPA